MHRDFDVPENKVHLAMAAQGIVFGTRMMMRGRKN